MVVLEAGKIVSRMNTTCYPNQDAFCVKGETINDKDNRGIRRLDPGYRKQMH